MTKNGDSDVITGQEWRRAALITGYMDMVIAQCKAGDFSFEDAKQKVYGVWDWLQANPNGVYSEFARQTIRYSEDPHEGNLLNNKMPDQDAEISIKTNSCVYIIGCGGLPEMIKIGITQHLDHRLGAISSSNPFKPYLIHVFYTVDPLSLERELHHQFRGKRTHGEWFALSDEDVIDAIDAGESILASDTLIGTTKEGG